MTQSFRHLGSRTAFRRNFVIFATTFMFCGGLLSAAEESDEDNPESQSEEASATAPDISSRAEKSGYPRALPITVSADGSLLAMVTDKGQLQVRNPRNDQILFKRDTGKVTALAFSPDGARVAAYIAAGKVFVWDLESEIVQSMEAETTVLPHHALVFIDDSTLATTNGRFGVVIWKLSNNDRFTLSDERIYICSLAVSPDGQFLAVGRGEFPIAFLPRGGGPAVTGPGITRIWNLEKAKVVQELKGHKHYGVQSLAYSPDGKTLASCGDSLILWDTETFEKQQQIEDDVRFFWTVDFSPDGKTIATATMIDPFIKVWGVNGELIHTIRDNNKKGYFAARFLSHSRELVSAAGDGSIRRWIIPPTAPDQ